MQKAVFVISKSLLVRCFFKVPVFYEFRAAMKKQLLPHIYFWLCYILFISFIEFLWNRATLLTLSQQQHISTAVKSSLLTITPKIIFAYYLLQYAARRIAKTDSSFIYSAAGLLLVLFVCVLTDRWVNNFIVLPCVYHGVIEQASLFELRRVIIVLLYIGFSSGLLLAMQSVKKQIAAVEREKELTKQKLETELKFLRNQTNPHFLMNTLNNIYALARKKSDDTAEVVMRLSEILRFMLYESAGSLISLDDEIKVLEDYLALEQIRYGKRLTVKFYKEADGGGYQVTPLLLLPFVENAFKHGVSETRFESFISIGITVKNGLLNFSIQNTADSGSPACTKNSIGLNNVKRQLELTYKTYRLDVKNENNIFDVTLSLNLKSHVEI
jgi:two-component system, LytTR family, sensor kinase